jgi:SAM-dependent methyltransferase
MTRSSESAARPEHCSSLEEVGLMAAAQQEIDRKNREFWDELCGTSLARSLGIRDVTPEGLARFDQAYMALYPYLNRYMLPSDLRTKRVLEIGLGYGTLGQLLAGHAAHYVGVDIATGPVAMMGYRLSREPGGRSGAALQASALALPFADRAFDYVYTIGCLHHTGDLPRAVAEVHRVLVPGGRAVVMLYNRHSFRRLVYAPLKYIKNVTTGRHGLVGVREFMRRIYDANQQGEAAPHTEFVSRLGVRRLFRAFSGVRIESQNFDAYVLFKGRVVVPRERLLSNVGRVLGLDLYIVATK